MGSVVEAEVGRLYTDASELSPIRTTLVQELDHSTADVIMSKIIEQRQSKAMDKIFFWPQDRLEQGEFRVFWAPGKYNLAVYFNKYYSPVTHRKLRPIYTYIKGKYPTILQGCIEILTQDSAHPYSNSKTTKPGNRTNPNSNS